MVVSVSIDFPSNTKWDALLHHIAYDYFRADWNRLCDHMRNVPWDDRVRQIAACAYVCTSMFDDHTKIFSLVYVIVHGK